MNIGLEVTGCLSDTPTGIAAYIQNLFGGLRAHFPEDRIEAYYWFALKKRFKPNLDRLRNAERISKHFYSFNIHRLASNLDISHSTDSRFLSLPGTKKIATVHDLAIFRRETAAIEDYTTDKFRERQLRLMTLKSQKADGIITVSNSTRCDFLEMFPHFDESKIRTIYLASPLRDHAADNEREILRKFDVKPRSYFLFVGAVSVRKNILNIISAFKMSGLHAHAKLLLAGQKSMGIERIMSAVSDSGLESRILFADYVEDELLPMLYRNSLGLVFPTYYEGFGIPIIEAMKFGVPVMHGNIGSAPEIGNGLGIEVDPFSVGEIADGLVSMENVKSESLQKAQEYANTFSWEKCTKETRDFYEFNLG